MSSSWRRQHDLTASSSSSSLSSRNQLCRSKVYCRTAGDRQGELHDLLDKLMAKTQKLSESSVCLYYFRYSHSCRTVCVSVYIYIGLYIYVYIYVNIYIYVNTFIYIFMLIHF